MIKTENTKYTYSEETDVIYIHNLTQPALNNIYFLSMFLYIVQSLLSDKNTTKWWLDNNSLTKAIFIHEYATIIIILPSAFIPCLIQFINYQIIAP
jgi:hypothetical protein